MNTQQFSQVLDRLLDPIADCLTPDVAVANLRARPDVQARIDELAEKCNEGELTPVEQVEYRDIVEAIDFISILQAKARARSDRAGCHGFVLEPVRVTPGRAHGFEDEPVAPMPNS